MAKFVINLKDVMDVSTRDYISNNVEMFKVLLQDLKVTMG